MFLFFNSLIFQYNFFHLTTLIIFTGAEILISKLSYYRPRIAVFNGKGIYEVFSGKKDFQFGKQPEMFPHSDTVSIVFEKKTVFFFSNNVFYS